MAARRHVEELVSRCNLGIVRLERGDVAGARSVFEGLEASATTQVVLQVAIGLALGACAALQGDRALWRRASAPWTGGVGEGMPLDPDFSSLAERAGRAAGRAGWLDEAVHAWRVALEVAARQGLTDLVRTQERRLRRLADDGAGTPLGPFFLVRPLSSGSFGEVWIARHHAGARVAIKLLAGRLDQAREQLDNELRHVAALEAVDRRRRAALELVVIV